MYIQQADLLRGMERRFVKEFLGIAMKESHEAGDFLFRKGEKAGRFYILVRGHIRLILGSIGHVVHVIDRTGEAFGWSSLVGRSIYSASAECVVPTKVLRFESEELQPIIERNPGSGLIFFRRLSRILGDRLIQGYEEMPGMTQEDISISFGSGQTMEMGASW